MSTKKPSKLIVAVLCFAILIFGLGAYFFFKYHNDNLTLKEDLVTNGIKTKGYILSLDTKDVRKLSYTDFKWQFMTDYLVEYWYNHDGQADRKGISLKDYIDTDSESTSASSQKVEDLGRIEIQNSISKTMYKAFEGKQSIDIIYLLGQPKTAKILTADGKIQLPPLNVIAYISLFLLLSSIGMLVYYMRTGTTF